MGNRITKESMEFIAGEIIDAVPVSDSLEDGWITSGSARVVRMAFNLFCNGTLGAHALEGDEKVKECQRYTVEDLFC